MSQQWEYCHLSYRSEDNVVVYHDRSGQIVRHDVDQTSAMAQLGLAGWELVGIHFSERSSNYYFKRLIEPGRAIDDAL